MEDILDKFSTLTEKPVKFLTVQKDLKDDITNLVKSLYDITKADQRKKRKGVALPKLIVKDFDEEQIWQQIDLHNTETWDQLVWDVANGISTKKDLNFPVKIKSEVDDSQGEDEHSASDAKASCDEEIKEKSKKTKKPKSNLRKVKSSIVDDKFFRLNEMEQFLLQEEKEKKATSDSEESIDLFDDVDDESDEEGAQGMYNDFFDGDDDNGDGSDDNGDGNDEGGQDDSENENDIDLENVELEDENTEGNKKKSKKDKKVSFAAMEDSRSDDENAVENDEPNTKKDNKDENKSDFELRQDRLKQTINRLEGKMLKEAPWQLKGEVDAVKRPQNSLLEEVVDFDLTSRPPPIITEQTTLTLEDIIRQRIKDKAWDDVEKKEKPVDGQLQFRKPEILDHSKSKLSLAQVYEAEYLKQKQAASGETVEEEEPEAHKEVKEAMKKLFSKLDALCHYHYTPRAPQAEVKIVSNTPAISMEEVAPVATSDAALLAPEEVKKKHRGDLMSKEERSTTDKKRERRKKKQLQHKKGTVAKVTEHRNTTKGVEANDKSLKTSKAFFQQLNDEATSIIKKKRKNKGQ